MKQVDCSGGGITHSIEKQALLDARWNATDECYVLRSGRVLSVRGMPVDVKDEIERVRISGTIDKKAADLEEEGFEHKCDTKSEVQKASMPHDRP